MNKKFKKFFACCLVTSIVLTNMLTTAFAAPLAGADRYATAAKIAAAGWTSADTAVLVTGANAADALAAAPLAAANDAPILLTGSASLDANAKKALTDLGVDKVYVVGGEVAVSAAVVSAVEALDIEVERVKGDDRFATSVAVAEELADSDTVVLVNGLKSADALSVSAVAAAKGYPILLTAATKVSDAVKNFIGDKEVIVVGGDQVVAPTAVAGLDVVKTLAGADRYATNKAILEYFAADIDFANVLLATGVDAGFADALAGSAYAAKLGAPIVLVGSTLDAGVKNFLAGKVDGTTTVVALGGYSTVANAAKVVEGLVPAELGVVSVTALNANEIKIVFNKELNETSAETYSNYSIDTVVLDDTDVVELQADKKSVVIKFAVGGIFADGLLDNNTAYEVAVLEGLEAADEKTLADDTSKTILFKDSVDPTVSSIATKENGDIVITFSERLDESDKPDIIVDEVAVNAANVTVDDATVTVDAADAAVAALDNNESYSIVVSGAEDLIGNEMDLYSTTFKYSVTNEAPSVVSVKADSEVGIEVTFDEEISNIAVAGIVKAYKGTTQIAVSSVTQDADDEEVYVIALDYDDVYESDETSASIRVKFDGYKDAENNLGNKYEATVTLTKDKVKPTVDSVKFDADADTLTLEFSEDLAAVLAATYAGDLYVTDEDGVRYNVVALDTVAENELLATNVADGADEVVLGTSDMENGTYTLTIAAGTFTDKSEAANTNAVKNVTFTVTDASDDDKPGVLTVEETVKGTFVVTFDEPVKGGNVAGSATNRSNYKINGSVLPADTTIYLNADKDAATITVPAGTVATTGIKLITISNVQDADGNVMNTVTKTESLTDNKDPELLSAKVNADKELVLTFSEELSDLDATDLEIKLNGVTVTDAVVAVDADDDKVYNVTSASFNFATGTITVKTIEDEVGTIATDAAGNELTTDTVKTATR